MALHAVCTEYIEQHQTILTTYTAVFHLTIRPHRSCLKHEMAAEGDMLPRGLQTVKSNIGLTPKFIRPYIGGCNDYFGGNKQAKDRCVRISVRNHLLLRVFNRCQTCACRPAFLCHSGIGYSQPTSEVRLAVYSNVIVSYR